MTTGAGQLDTRCAFQTATEVSDGGGGYTTTWSTQFSRWGALAMQNLRSHMEEINAGSVTSVVQADLLIRDDSETTTITEAWRVTARGWTWNIRKRQPGYRGYIRLVIEQGVPDSGPEVVATSNDILDMAGEAISDMSGDTITDMAA